MKITNGMATVRSSSTFPLGRGFYGIFLRHTVKKLAEFIRHKENFCNFVLGEHSDYCLCFFSSLGAIKGTTIFANHQIFRQLNFIELTLSMSKRLAILSVLSIVAGLFFVGISSCSNSEEDNYIKVDCTWCHATGKCYVCAGTGKGCFKCNGTGKYCSTCPSTGICVLCNGNARCNWCDGTGHEDCSYKCNNGSCRSCNGAGQQYNSKTGQWVTCSSCKGSGICKGCQGAGYQNCGLCKGSGNCTDCSGSGKCNSCHGNPVCSSCGGDGHCTTCKNSDGKCIKCDGNGYTMQLRNGGGNSGGSSGYNGPGSDDDDSGSGGNNSRRCNICNGKGDCRYWGSYYDVYHCHGSGKCQYCNGTGWSSSGVPCTNCDSPGGHGQPGNGKCSYCGGNGKCSSCGGTGYK